MYVICPSTYSDRFQWERKYCKYLTPSSIVECRLCENLSTGKTIISDFTDHLRVVHNIREIFDHPDHGTLLQEFTINEEECTAVCKICNSSINYIMYGVYLLKNHLELYHGNSSHIYKTIATTESGRDTLDKYIIKGSEATCPKCYQKINMADADLLTKIKLEELIEHYFCHKYEKKCFIFAKTCKNRFCFTCFIPIISNKISKTNSVNALLLYRHFFV